jgi:OOP family OmpA-OmpF porin
MTTRGKIVIGALIVALLYFGINKLVSSGAVFKKAETQSVLLNSIELPAVAAGSRANTVVPLAPLPGTAPADKGTPVVWEVMAWNSQMAGMLANGGPRSTMGSSMAANGVDLQIVRQDDVAKMQADLVKNALDLQSNPETPGLIVSIMGDGLPGFSAVQDQLKKAGTGLQILPYSCGKSFGEDKLMGPREWLENPKSALGKTIACYLRDGDQNIALKWCADNGLKVNPDETTYDPEAVNFMAASDFLVAAEKYILSKPEARTKVVKGKNTGVSVDVVADAVATWTPGDVNIAKQRGGLVNIVSTKDYSNQMPNIMVTTKRWYDAHPKEVEGIMTALAVAGDQVKSHPEALSRAADISAAVYGDQDKPGAYWLKYYKGVSEADRNGEVVELGGSKAFNFADNLSLFGLDNGGTNIYAAVYKTFGDVQSKLYPKELPSYVPLAEMLDLSPLKKLQEKYRGKTIAPAETQQVCRRRRNPPEREQAGLEHRVQHRPEQLHPRRPAPAQPALRRPGCSRPPQSSRPRPHRQPGRPAAQPAAFRRPRHGRAALARAPKAPAPSPPAACRCTPTAPPSPWPATLPTPAAPRTAGWKSCWATKREVSQG